MGTGSSVEDEGGSIPGVVEPEGPGERPRSGRFVSSPLFSNMALRFLTALMFGDVGAQRELLPHVEVSLARRRYWKKQKS